MRKACGLVIVLTVLSCASYHSSTDDSRGPATAAVQALLSGSRPYRGVNLNGADFGSAQLPGIFGIDYTYPDPTYVSGYNSADYFISKGMNPTFKGLS